jgi:hypothetical protein
VSLGQRNGSARPYSRFSRPENNNNNGGGGRSSSTTTTTAAAAAAAAAGMTAIKQTLDASVRKE